MNKKGKANVAGTVIAVVAVLLVAMIAAVLFVPGMLPSQSVTNQATVDQIAAATSSGDAASLKAYAYNETADAPNTKVAANSGYFWKKGNPTEILGGAQTMSASATTSIPSVNIGDTIEGIAFTTTNYGNTVEKYVGTETEQMKVPIILISTAMTYRIEEDGAVETAPDISVAANQENSFNKMIVEQSSANAEFRLKMICFNSSASSTDTNISNIKINDAKWKEVSTPIGRKQFQYCFETPTAMKLGEYDEYSYGPVVLEGDSDGCTSNETVTVAYIDEAAFVSKDGAIKFGVEDDSDSNSDVGASDASFYDSFVCYS